MALKPFGLAEPFFLLERLRCSLIGAATTSVLRWIDAATLEAGEDAVVAVLEEALSTAVAANGLTASGIMRVRPTRPGEYPQAEAARPADQPDAVLHLAEVDTA